MAFQEYRGVQEAQNDLLKALKEKLYETFPTTFDKILSRVDNINFGNGTNDSPLIIVCTGKFYNEDLIKRFVEMGADVNVVNHRGSTTLMLCVYYGSPSMVEFFASKGVDINHINNLGKTVMDYVKEGTEMFETVKRIFDASNPVTKDISNITSITSNNEIELIKNETEKLILENKETLVRFKAQIKSFEEENLRLQRTIFNIKGLLAGN